MLVEFNESLTCMYCPEHDIEYDQFGDPFANSICGFCGTRKDSHYRRMQKKSGKFITLKKEDLESKVKIDVFPEIKIKRKINKVSKGRRVENLAKDLIKSYGWLVDKKVRTRFASPDFFGWFDLLCIKDSRCKMVQVKSNRSDFNTAKREIKKWIEENKLNPHVQVWLYLGKGMWEIDTWLKFTSENEGNWRKKFINNKVSTV